MKIFCSERSLLFGVHSPLALSPGDFFLRSDNTFTNSGKTLYTPDWSSDLHYVPALVVRMSKVGKTIAEHFAHKYFQEIAFGISMMDPLYFRESLSQQLDPSLAYDFDGSLVVSSFFSKEKLPNYVEHLVLNKGTAGSEMQQLSPISPARVSDGLIHRTIAMLSHYYLIKMGDCITFPLTDELQRINPEEQHLLSLRDDSIILNASIK